MSAVGEQLIEVERRRKQLYAEARQVVMETIGRLSLAAPVSLVRLDLAALRAGIERLARLRDEMAECLEEHERLKLAASAEVR